MSDRVVQGPFVNLPKIKACFVFSLLSSIDHLHVPHISDDKKLSSEAEGYVRVGGHTRVS